MFGNDLLLIRGERPHAGLFVASSCDRQHAFSSYSCPSCSPIILHQGRHQSSGNKHSLTSPVLYAGSMHTLANQS